MLECADRSSIFLPIVLLIFYTTIAINEKATLLVHVEIKVQYLSSKQYTFATKTSESISGATSCITNIEHDTQYPINVHMTCIAALLLTILIAMVRCDNG